MLLHSAEAYSKHTTKAKQTLSVHGPPGSHTSRKPGYSDPDFETKKTDFKLWSVANHYPEYVWQREIVIGHIRSFEHIHTHRKSLSIALSSCWKHNNAEIMQKALPSTIKKKKTTTKLRNYSPFGNDHTLYTDLSSIISSLWLQGFKKKSSVKPKAQNDLYN